MNRIRPFRQSGERRLLGEASPHARGDLPAKPAKLRARGAGRRDGRLAKEACLRVLHVGCGRASPSALHPMFKGADWQEIRLDIDRATQPDIVASATDLGGQVEDQSCDAIWSSHTLEHLCRHEVQCALREFHRVLAPAGFVLIRCPDAEEIARFVIEGRIDETIYTSPAGPVTPLDMLYGHGGSIEGGNQFMRHGTAFTQDLLARDLLAADFAEVRTRRPGNYEVWAAAFMPSADIDQILGDLAKAGLDLRG